MKRYILKLKQPVKVGKFVYTIFGNKLVQIYYVERIVKKGEETYIEFWGR